MSFHDVQFPPEISYGATGGFEFNTLIATATRSKKEWRDILDEQGVVTWNVAPGCTDEVKLAQLIAFIRNRYGNAYSFRFKDWSDYKIERQTIAVGDGATSEFQLVKVYDDGVFQVTRDITKPVVGTASFWVAGSPFTPAIFNPLTGMISLGTSPSSGVPIEAECEFDVPVRFEKDGLRMNLANFDHTRSQVTVREVFGE